MSVYRIAFEDGEIVSVNRVSHERKLGLRFLRDHRVLVTLEADDLMSALVRACSVPLPEKPEPKKPLINDEDLAQAMMGFRGFTAKYLARHLDIPVFYIANRLRIFHRKGWIREINKNPKVWVWRTKCGGDEDDA